MFFSRQHNESKEDVHPRSPVYQENMVRSIMQEDWQDVLGLISRYEQNKLDLDPVETSVNTWMCNLPLVDFFIYERNSFQDASKCLFDDEKLANTREVKLAISEVFLVSISSSWENSSRKPNYELRNELKRMIESDISGVIKTDKISVMFNALSIHERERLCDHLATIFCKFAKHDTVHGIEPPGDADIHAAGLVLDSLESFRTTRQCLASLTHDDVVTAFLKKLALSDVNVDDSLLIAEFTTGGLNLLLEEALSESLDFADDILKRPKIQLTCLSLYRYFRIIRGVMAYGELKEHKKDNLGALMQYLRVIELAFFLFDYRKPVNDDWRFNIPRSLIGNDKMIDFGMLQSFMTSIAKPYELQHVGIVICQMLCDCLHRICILLFVIEDSGSQSSDQSAALDMLLMLINPSSPIREFFPVTMMASLLNMSICLVKSEIESSFPDPATVCSLEINAEADASGKHVNLNKAMVEYTKTKGKTLADALLRLKSILNAFLDCRSTNVWDDSVDKKGLKDITKPLWTNSADVRDRFDVRQIIDNGRNTKTASLFEIRPRPPTPSRLNGSLMLKMLCAGRRMEWKSFDSDAASGKSRMCIKSHLSLILGPPPSILLSSFRPISENISLYLPSFHMNVKYNFSCPRICHLISVHDRRSSKSHRLLCVLLLSSASMLPLCPAVVACEMSRLFVSSSQLLEAETILLWGLSCHHTPISFFFKSEPLDLNETSVYGRLFHNAAGKGVDSDTNIDDTSPDYFDLHDMLLSYMHWHLAMLHAQFLSLSCGDATQFGYCGGNCRRKQSDVPHISQSFFSKMFSTSSQTSDIVNDTDMEVNHWRSEVPRHKSLQTAAMNRSQLDCLKRFLTHMTRSLSLMRRNNDMCYRLFGSALSDIVIIACNLCGKQCIGLSIPALNAYLSILAMSMSSDTAHRLCLPSSHSLSKFKSNLNRELGKIFESTEDDDFEDAIGDINFSDQATPNWKPKSLADEGLTDTWINTMRTNIDECFSSLADLRSVHRSSDSSKHVASTIFSTLLFGKGDYQSLRSVYAEASEVALIVVRQFDDALSSLFVIANLAKFHMSSFNEAELNSRERCWFGINLMANICLPMMSAICKEAALHRTILLQQPNMLTDGQFSTIGVTCLPQSIIVRNLLNEVEGSISEAAEDCTFVLMDILSRQINLSVLPCSSTLGTSLLELLLNLCHEIINRGQVKQYCSKFVQLRARLKSYVFIGHEENQIRDDILLSICRSLRESRDWDLISQLHDLLHFEVSELEKREDCLKFIEQCNGNELFESLHDEVERNGIEATGIPASSVSLIESVKLVLSLCLGGYLKSSDAEIKLPHVIRRDSFLSKVFDVLSNNDAFGDWIDDDQLLGNRSLMMKHIASTFVTTDACSLDWSIHSSATVFHPETVIVRSVPWQPMNFCFAAESRILKTCLYLHGHQSPTISCKFQSQGSFRANCCKFFGIEIVKLLLLCSRAFQCCGKALEAEECIQLAWQVQCKQQLDASLVGNLNKPSFLLPGSRFLSDCSWQLSSEDCHRILKDVRNLSIMPEETKLDDVGDQYVSQMLCLPEHDYFSIEYSESVVVGQILFEFGCLQENENLLARAESSYRAALGLCCDNVEYSIALCRVLIKEFGADAQFSTRSLPELSGSDEFVPSFILIKKRLESTVCKDVMGLQQPGGGKHEVTEDPIDNRLNEASDLLNMLHHGPPHQCAEIEYLKSKILSLRSRNRVMNAN